MPIAMKIAIKNEPPQLTKGKGMPITGKNPIFVPMLIKNWTITMSPTPKAKSREKLL